jgi:hypothetical protein
MPFANSAQRRACFAQYRRDIQRGIVPRWDCYEWERSGRVRKSGSRKKSERKGRSRSGSRKGRSKSRSRKRSPVRLYRKVYTGRNGGRYVIYRGRKVYV